MLLFVSMLEEMWVCILVCLLYSWQSAFRHRSRPVFMHPDCVKSTTKKQDWCDEVWVVSLTKPSNVMVVDLRTGTGWFLQDSGEVLFQVHHLHLCHDQRWIQQPPSCRHYTVWSVPKKHANSYEGEGWGKSGGDSVLIMLIKKSIAFTCFDHRGIYTSKRNSRLNIA